MQEQIEEKQQLMTLRIIWFALNCSLLVYGYGLFMAHKISYIGTPVSLSLFQQLALANNLLVLVSIYFHKNKILPKNSLRDRLTPYVMCWALNESIVVTAFAATFLSNDGNGFFYVVNASVALLANIMMMPRLPENYGRP